MLLNNKNKISVEHENLYSFLKDKQIGIPIFQRFYAWNPSYIKQLLADITEALKDEDYHIYYLDFIYYEENDSIMLADGQQRLVTLNLLIKVLMEFAKEGDFDIYGLELFNIFYDIPSNQEKYRKTFEEYPVAPFKKVYLALYDFVRKNKGKIPQIANIIKKSIYGFFKKCSDSNEAFLIFQQINTGMKPLTKDDIIRTALDQYSKMYSIELSTKKIKSIKQMLASYYKYVMDDTSLDFDNIAIISFLKEYITKDKQSFKKFVETVQSLSKLEKNPMSSIINYINRMSLYDVLNILALKHIDIFANKHRKYLDDVVIPLVMISIVLSAKGGNPVVLKYLLNDVLAMIKNDDSVNDINMKICTYVDQNSSGCKISFEDFCNKMGNPDFSQGIKKALLILDVVYRNHSGMVEVEKINLEHVYPKNPCADWARHGWPTGDEEKSKYINNIGNYILLCESVNKSISNKYISDKKVRYKEIFDKDLVLNTPINRLDFDKLEEDGPDFITDRQEKICVSIRQNIPFGQKLIGRVPH